MENHKATMAIADREPDVGLHIQNFMSNWRVIQGEYGI